MRPDFPSGPGASGEEGLGPVPALDGERGGQETGRHWRRAHTSPDSDGLTLPPGALTAKRSMIVGFPSARATGHLPCPGTALASHGGGARAAAPGADGLARGGEAEPGRHRLW